MSSLQFALVGNPNCGKSSLFNRLTGANQHIGNWPGVTVERVEGHFTHKHQKISVVDLPGMYALSDDTAQFSTDEQIAQQAVLDDTADIYINVIDGSNLGRHLFLSSQLLEKRVNMIVAINMIDIVRQRGITIDIDALAKVLQCPVVTIASSTGEGIKSLTDTALAQLDKPVETVEEQDNTVNAEPMSIAEHYGRVEKWLDECIGATDTKETLTDKIDSLVLNRYLSFPIFLAVVYCMFMFSINIGSAFIDVFDGIAGLLFVETPLYLMEQLQFPEWLAVFIAEGVGGGIQLVASFIPVIGAMFFILAWLEDSGYMARAAFVMDRIMRQLGLPGKAFVPLVVGFGCNVPSVMATRTLDNERDRITAIMMTPFMSCGARLTVYALFAAAFFPTGGHNMVFALYLIGILIAVLSAFALKKTLLKGESGNFVLELPNYHLPLFRNIILRTWHRLQGFVVRAGKAIVAVVIVLNVVNSIGIDGSFGNQNTEKSVLSQIGKSITPIFKPMGLSEDNWPATVGIFTGIFAKEVVVGTLDSLYSQGAPEEEGDYNFVGSLKSSLATVPENLAGLANQITDPLGFSIIGGDLVSAAEAQDVDTRTFTALQKGFDGKIGAFAYLLFVLLYIPCIATIGAMYREIDGAWSAFITVWSLGSGYGVAVGFYQAATFARHPFTSGIWLAFIVASITATIWFLRRHASNNEIHQERTIIARSSG